MKFDGTVGIEAGRQQVWDFLTDAEAVSQCAPGLESMTVIEPGKRFEAVAGIGFGTVKVRFTTDVQWVELDPPNMAKMKAHGNAPGSAVDVLAHMELQDGPDGSTQMNWAADVTISGTITSLASRLMGSVTKKVTQNFFDCVKKKLEG